MGERQKRYQSPSSDVELRVREEPIADRTIYKPINIYSCPRSVGGDGTVHQKSLVYYTPKVEISNARKSYEQKYLSISSYRKLEVKDGMIAQFKEMGKYKQNNGESLRALKVLICVCMYNESKHAINLTLRGIYENLRHFQKAGLSHEEIGVVLLQDGILKLVQNRKKRTFAKGEASMVHFYKDLDRHDGKNKCELETRINIILDEIDSYNATGQQDYVKKNRDFPPSIEKNISLLYQNLWKPSMTDYGNETGAPLYAGQQYGQQKQPYYLKLFSCFKHLNGTKLSSHLWFFEGFCRYLKPQFIVLLDVGTKSDPTGIINMIRGFDNQWVGGVTGLLSIDSDFPSEEGADEKDEEEGCFMKAFGSIQKAQEYQYIISHFLDKNAEGALGFLHVLPGAWSAYRYSALVKSQQHELDLLSRSYFKTILNPDAEEKDHEEANMYLAEDRILSLGIYCQWDSKYYLKYVPDAIAKTDPMKNHQNLMKQRRRWINSSMYAFFYVLRNYYFNVLQSRHSVLDKYLWLNLSMLLGLLGVINTYISPSVYFYILYVSIFQIDKNSILVSVLAKVVSLIFLLLYLAAIAGGLTGASWTKHAGKISAVLSLFFFSMWGLVTYNVLVLYIGIGTNTINIQTTIGLIFVIMSLINVASFFIIIIMHIFTHPGYVFKMFKDWPSYTSYQGAYSITMVTHAFCNIDDVSWGTKGAAAASGAKKYQLQKVLFVGFWLFINSFLAYIFIYIDLVLPAVAPSNKEQGTVLLIIGIYATSVLTFKSILAIAHHFKWMFTRCCNSNWTGLTQEEMERRKNEVSRFWRKSEQQYMAVQTAEITTNNALFRL